MSLITAIRIPATSTEYIGMTVTGPAEVDLMDNIIEMAVVGAAAIPGNSDWVTPTLLTFRSQHVAQVQLLIGPGARVLTPGVYRLWARVWEAPETPVIASPEVFRIL